jgi:hypothetical protein
MAGPSPLTGARRDVVAIVEKSVSIGLAQWIDAALRDGADLAEIEQMLAGALRHIGRVNRHWQTGLRIPACETAA